MKKHKKLSSNIEIDPNILLTQPGERHICAEFGCGRELPFSLVPASRYCPDHIKKQKIYTWDILDLDQCVKHSLRSSSNRIYVVAQHKKKRHWGCSCPGYRRFRRCKHLEAMYLPTGERPHEVNVVKL